MRRARNTGIFLRDPLDWYVEPKWVTTALLRAEPFEGPIWDPACGAGNVVLAARSLGLVAHGSDVVDRSDEAVWFLRTHDFLQDDYPAFGIDNIITNPPFFRAVGAEAFIRRALSLARRKVAIFVDLKFLAGQKRAAGLFADHCPHRVYTLARRPSCPPGDWIAAGNTASGGTADWCWLVWDLTSPPAKIYQGAWLLSDDDRGAA